jgi:hypothetical protein
LDKDKIKVQHPGSTGVEGHKVGMLPGVIKTEGQDVLLDLRGRKLSSSRLAVTLNQIMNRSDISSVTMDTDENNTI